MAKEDRKAKRKRRSGGLLDILNGFLTLAVLGLIVGVGAFFWGASQFYAAGSNTEQSTFFVEQGNGMSTIAGRLQEQKLIDNALLFRVVSWPAREAKILPGEYTIPAKASMADILKIITSGEPVEYFVMVNPGQSSFEVATLLNDPSEKLTGDPVAQPREGTVLPIRHDYFPGSSRADLLKKMTDEMTATVDRLWAQCLKERTDVCGTDAPLKTKADLVILASLVEEETGIASERPIVAGLFINRLKKNWLLQTDPTITYGIFKGEPQANRSITRSQKAKDTEYNTYKHKGLPPTPISNPGEAALEAAANPAQTNFMYMMAITPGDYSDGHAFAVSDKEHGVNVAKYRKLEDEQAEAREEAAAAEAQ